MYSLFFRRHGVKQLFSVQAQYVQMQKEYAKLFFDMHMSMDRWLDKQTGVYTYNGILFSLKKEGNSDTFYNMDEP